MQAPTESDMRVWLTGKVQFKRYSVGIVLLMLSLYSLVMSLWVGVLSREVIVKEIGLELESETVVCEACEECAPAPTYL
jgi:hypothetical protein